MTILILFSMIIDIVGVGCMVRELDKVKIDFVTKPVTFGKTAEISCIANGTEIPINESSRSWTGGPNNTLLCKDGISANKTKYTENMGKDKSQFILKIYNFSELDVDCIYSCTFGVDSAKKTFNLNQDDFQYAMIKEMIQIKSYIEKDNLKVDIEFIKVWPKPYCDISFEGINYDANKTSTTITSNGKLYSAIITLMLRKQSCRGEMFVVCHIGNQHIVVQKKRLEKCPVTDGNKSKNIFYASVICIIISVILIVVVVVPIVLVLKKERGHSLCSILSCSVHLENNRWQTHRDAENQDDTVSIYQTN